MSKKSSSKKRFKFFVDREVQGTLARRFVFHWISLGFCLFMMTAVVHVIANPLQTPEQQLETYINQHARIFVVLAMLTPAFVWDSVKLSNRFCGPVSRLRRALLTLGRGEETPPLKFRNGDFWQDLATSFNDVRTRVQDAERQVNASDSEESETEDTPADREEALV